jgi:hypothetical protein
MISFNEDASEMKENNIIRFSDEDDTELDLIEEESEENRKFYVTLKQNMPVVNIEKFPLYIETKLPAYGSLDSNFTVINRIKNNSKKLVSLECSLDDNAFFSIGGNKLVCLIF